MSLCQNIDTLAMAHLDDELAPEERRELELHLLECASCKRHVEGERAELAMLRGALAAPPAPDLLKARIAHALDDEDREAARATRRRWGAWLLPGSAMAAAAAAIVAFISVRAPVGTADSGRITREAVGQVPRNMPLEVEGLSTLPWLRQHFARDVAPPQFTQPGIELRGARLTDVSGHQAAIVEYWVLDNGNRYPLTAMLIVDVGGDDLSGGVPVKVGDRTLHLHEANGMRAVTFVDEQGLGYAFTATRLTAPELLQLVVTSDLIGRAQRGR